MIVNIELNKEEVYEEVKKTSWYVGVKLGDESYKIIAINDEDRIMLDRFFEESKSLAINRLIKVFDKEVFNLDNKVSYLYLKLSDDFNKNLLPGIVSSFKSFLALNILAKWFAFTNKPEAEQYATEAVAMLEDVAKKVRYKLRPRH
jgi:hypothetical protein